MRALPVVGMYVVGLCVLSPDSTAPPAAFMGADAELEVPGLQVLWNVRENEWHARQQAGILDSARLVHLEEAGVDACVRVPRVSSLLMNVEVEKLTVSRSRH